MVEDSIKKIVDEYIQYVTADLDRHAHEEKYKFDAVHHFQDTFDLNAENLAENIKSSLAKVNNLAVGAGYYPVASLHDIAQNEPNQMREALRILFSDGQYEFDRIARFLEIMIPLSERYSHKNVSHPFNMDLRCVSLLLSLRRPDAYMYFKPTEVDRIYLELYGEKTGTSGSDIDRILKARNLGQLILNDLKGREAFHVISEIMGYTDDHNLWFAQDVIWWTARNRGKDVLSALEAKIRSFLDIHPQFLTQVELTSEQISLATQDFQTRFSPQALNAMSDDEIVKTMIYNEASTKDGLSYLLEHSPVIGHMGGIRGGSAAKMGYYQGLDGQWKKFQSNAPTSKEDVLHHRRIDIEILKTADSYIANQDFVGLAAYQKSLKDAAAEAIKNNVAIVDSDERYKSVFLGLVWVRKYFAILYPESFIEIFGNDFINRLEKLAGIGDISGDTSNGDYSIWYKKMYQISKLAEKFDLSNYELSRILWTMIKQEEAPNEGEVTMEDSKSNNLSLNTIIYGPPGTGKTFSISGYKQLLLDSQVSKYQGLLNGTVKDTLLFLFSLDNTPKSAGDIWRSGDFQNHQQYNGRTRSNSAAIQLVLEGDPAIFERIQEGSRVKYRATEEGLEAANFISEAQSDEAHRGAEDFYEFVTFHQSYGYEEFIEGIRAETNDSGAISYSVRDGVFKAFCRRAENDPQNNYLFVIDEINRGNISKIFGELITLVEPNKRLNAKEQLTSTLPYSGEKFGVPKNVYIIGTMNTADRSIALLDIALRRRFNFVEIMPEPSILAEDLEGINLQKLLMTVNRKVVDSIDRNHQIGHSYLMGVTTLGELQDAWYQRIVPLLQEYFYDDTSDLQDVIKSFIDNEEIVVKNGEDFKQALIDIYDETQSTTARIQL